MSLRLGVCLIIIVISYPRQIQSHVKTPSKYFAIRVVDAETNRGVPLIQLETVNHRKYWTDSNGLVAFYELGLMDQHIFFHVSGHGYEYLEDGFGYRGVKLYTTSGGESEIKVKRLNLAERLYRITGQGIYNDSLKLDRSITPNVVPFKAQVMGSDSVVSVVYNDHIYWFWGDTNCARYPLGNFHVPGALSKLPVVGGLLPEQGINFEYFVNNDGFVKETCKMSGKGPTWIDCLMLLNDDHEAKRIFAVYMKVQNWLDIYERGIVEFDIEKQQFQRRMVFPKDQVVIPQGHPFLHQVDDKSYFYFAGAMPWVRVPADVEAILNPASYESYSFLLPSQSSKLPNVHRDVNGNLIWSWRKDVPWPNKEMIQQLVEDKMIVENEAPNLLTDIESGKLVITHHGSVYWNAYRNRWVMITTQSSGTSYLGEIWYSEAIRPEGPWAYGRKIITHNQYSFYNPKHHPMFDQKDGKVIYLEGTYATTFSGNDYTTPGYDYNQIMYRLDLSQPELNLPQPVYHVSSASKGSYWQVGAVDDTESKLLCFVLVKPHLGTRAIELGDTTIYVNSSVSKSGESLTIPLWKLEAQKSITWQVGDINGKQNKRLVGYVWPIPSHVSR